MDTKGPRVLPHDPGRDARLVYEDDDVLVVRQHGASPFLLVTFGDLITLPNGTKFWGSEPARKLGLDALGFVAKRGNWYPSDSMERAAAALAPLLASRSERVMYGSSMGGYAALRYAARLGANSVVALCPQWSIDAGECGGRDPGYTTYFTPRLAGMGIRGGDMAGRVVLFADLGNAQDAFHVSRIRDARPSASVVNMPGCGHDIALALAGTAMLGELLSAVRTGDHLMLRRVGRRGRLRSVTRGRDVLLRAASRHPRRAARMVLAAADPIRDCAVAAGAARTLVEGLVERGDLAAAASVATELAGELAFTWQFRRAMVAARARATRLVIVTDWGTVLAYDLTLGVAVHVTVATLDANAARLVAVTLALRGNAATLACETAGMSFELRPTGTDRRLRFDVAEPARGDRFVLEPHGVTFALRDGAFFLCADSGADILCDRREVSGWERFRVAPLDELV